MFDSTQRDESFNMPKSSFPKAKLNIYMLSLTELVWGLLQMAAEIVFRATLALLQTGSGLVWLA